MRTARRIGKALALGVVLGGLAVLYGWLYVHTPAGRDAEPRLVTVPAGASLRDIASRLKQAGVIRHESPFVFYARLRGVARRLQAGEYALRATMSPAQILAVLSQGKVLYHSLTIPEGATVRDIATLVAAKGLGDRQVLLDLAHDPDFIASLGLAVPSLEGYLFPDTYHVPRGMDERDLLRLMVRTLQRHYREHIAARAQALGLSQHAVLTLASLIEKETAVEEERPLIAAVFHNRLRRGMPLQADPTVIYALGERFDGNLRKADLTIDSPYNTYRYRGLPPGPIANPGLRALQAAVAPAPVDYLYFVATGEDGRHHFSATLEEHNRAVRQYQLRQAHP